MNIQESVTTCLNKYMDFNGRAMRSEYWWFVLFVSVVYFVTALINHYLYAIAILALIVPTFAVTVRRLHDTDRSGWWILLNLIPLVGALIVLYFMILEGTPGSNRFGSQSA